MASLRSAVSEVRAHVSLADLLHLTTVGAVGAVLRNARPGVEQAPLADGLAVRDPALLGALADLYSMTAVRYHRPRIVGIEHLPAEGPVLLVGNHGGGTISTDAYMTMWAIWRERGPNRVVNPLVHDLMLSDPVLRRLLPRLGALRAGRSSAGRALSSGHVVLVYPAGDLEACRTFGQRNVVDFGGRTGFVRLAQEAGVPIVPVVAAGPHEQLLVLTRGEWLARALQTHRWMRTDSLPVALALPWGLTSGYLPYLPLPAQITVEFGEPVAPPEQGDDDLVASCADEVTSRMQRMLSEITKGRVPWVGWQLPGRSG